jgi:hypothetical protein
VNRIMVVALVSSALTNVSRYFRLFAAGSICPLKTRTTMMTLLSSPGRVYETPV